MRSGGMGYHTSNSDVRYDTKPRVRAEFSAEVLALKLTIEFEPDVRRVIGNSVVRRFANEISVVMLSSKWIQSKY